MEQDGSISVQGPTGTRPVQGSSNRRSQESSSGKAGLNPAPITHGYCQQPKPYPGLLRVSRKSATAAELKGLGQGPNSAGHCCSQHTGPMLLFLAGEGGAGSTLLHLRPSHVCYLRGQTLCWGIKSLIQHNKVLKRSEQVVTGDIPNTSHIPQILLTLTSWGTGCPGPPQASQRKSDLSSQAQTQSLESTQ